MEIDISNSYKPEVLAALYNASKPTGMGFIKYVPGDMTIQEAKKLLLETKDFDNIKGRPMKINLSGDTFDSTLYDRDLGKGAAKKALEGIV